MYNTKSFRFLASLHFTTVMETAKKTSQSVSECSFQFTHPMHSYAWCYVLPPTGLCCARSNINYHHHRLCEHGKFWMRRIMTMMHTKGFMREWKNERGVYFKISTFWFLVHIYHTLHNVITASCHGLFAADALVFVPHFFFPYMHFFLFGYLKVHFLAHYKKKKNAHTLKI